MWWLLLLSCWGEHTYIVKGTVVSVQSPDEVVLDHEAVPGLMDAMIMPFTVSDPALIKSLHPGHKVIARFVIGEDGGRLTKIRVVGEGPPVKNLLLGVPELQIGEVLPTFEVLTHRGGTIKIGAGQKVPTVVSFIYTRCPLPDYCPAVFAKLTALDSLLEDEQDARLVLITIDPNHDTLPILREHASKLSASPRLHLTRAPQLKELALRSGLSVAGEQQAIVHNLRYLVLDEEGTLIERYDDNYWPLQRALSQLRLGEPHAPAGVVGTFSKKPSEER